MERGTHIHIYTNRVLMQGTVQGIAISAPDVALESGSNVLPV